MSKYFSLEGASIERNISVYTLRGWCKQGKIRFNIAGNTKYILRMDWLDEDLEKMALENMKSSENTLQVGKLRKIED